MIRPPLLIISCSRSGSSLIAGIFQKHGYYVGSCREPDMYNAKGYFENLPVKMFMREFYNTNVKESRQGRILDWKEGFDKEAMRVLKKDGFPLDKITPWLIKFGANYFHPWYHLFPRASVISLWRNTSAIKKSGKRSFSVTQKRIDAAHGVMRETERTGCSAHVDFEEILSGNYTQLFPVFERENIDPDVKAIDEFVDPDLRHF